jgi:hypothetical protein
MEKPICPNHHSEMRQTYQLDLEKNIWACPNLGCKARYIEGRGHITTDEITPRRD